MAYRKRVDSAAHARAARTADIRERVRDAANVTIASDVLSPRNVPSKVLMTMQLSTDRYGKTPTLRIVRREVRVLLAEARISRTTTSPST